MRLVVPLALLAVFLLTPRVAYPVQPFPFCAPGQPPTFVHGFAALHAALGDTMGDPLECEHTEVATGDAHQRTTSGLAFYRKSTNTPTFTNGFEHWAITAAGMVSWTGASIDPPANATPAEPAAGAPEVVPCPHPYYTQCVSTQGILIKAPESVDPRAISRAHEIVGDLVSYRPDLRERMVRQGAALAIIPRDAYITALPDFSNLRGRSSSDGRPYDGFQIRGIGGVPGQPVSSTSEENLLKLPGDSYAGEDLTYHEFAHAVMNMGFSREEHQAWAAIYRRANASGQFAGTYADVDAEEFWAEMTQAWFNASHVFNAGVENAAQVLEKAPEAYAFLEAVYGPPR